MKLVTNNRLQEAHVNLKAKQRLKSLAIPAVNSIKICLTTKRYKYRLQEAHANLKAK